MFETNAGVIKPIVYVGIIRDSKLLLVDYVHAPNSAKSGWWIPAPGLGFGEDPAEKAEAIVLGFGFSPQNLKLKAVESFVLPGGWHLIYHYACNVIGELSGDVKTSENIKAHKWVNAQELDEMKDMAHGRWEIGVGQSYL